MVKKEQLIKSPTYLSFIRKRDLALECILHNSQLRITDILNDIFKFAMLYINHELQSIDTNEPYSMQTKQRLKRLETNMEWAFDSAAYRIMEVVTKMRRRTFLLASAGEGEAIGRAIGKQTKTHVLSDSLDKIANKDSPSGGQFSSRVKLYLNDINRNIIGALERGILMGEDKDQIIQRVFAELPKKKNYVQPRRALIDPAKPMREAEREKVARIDVGYVTPEDWNGLVQDYMDEYIPTTRGPESVVGKVKDVEGDTKEIYAWELERDVTQSFIEDVREGQIDAAKKNGILDFVWIAIIDDKTDDCCLWRDGLTTSQIEEQLGGKHADDECQAITPPAHFNCRCTLSPALEGLDELIPESNAAEFDEWLRNKANQ